MTERKRRFWQIHLSTALVMMFVAGTLLYFNLKPPHLEEVEGRHGFPFQWDYPDEDVPAWIVVGTDLTITMLFLFFAWCVCEYAIKLGEARVPEEPR